MKYVRKSLALLLALILVLALGGTAFATQEGTLTGGSITIKDAVPGQIYKAYQILYLESYSHTTDKEGNITATGAYAYKANGAWETWLKTQTDFVSFDGQGYVTWVEGADAAAFAKAAQVEAAKMTADATATAPAATEGATYSTVTFSDLKLGYYLVDTTLGTLCSLDTTNPNVTMEEKNEAPTNEKLVEEDRKVSTGDAWGTTNDADIGQTVNFKSVITAQVGAENYVFHDKMSDGLTLDKTSIKVNGVAVTDAQGNDLAGDNYTVSYPTGEGADGCTFEIAFTNEYISALAADTKIEVTYTATVNESAVVGLPGNPNKVKLEYGDNATPNYTPTQETITYTWDMDVLKYADGDEQNVLAGVKFILLNNDKSKVANVQNGKLVSWDAMPTQGEGESDEEFAARLDTFIESHKLTTNANGKIEIDGLDADTYYLRETDALPGYNPLTTDQPVEIKGATAEQNTLTYTTKVVKINNNKGTSLPSTGGMGTTILYAVGGVLVLAAFVLIVTKRRASEN